MHSRNKKIAGIFGLILIGFLTLQPLLDAKLAQAQDTSSSAVVNGGTPSTEEVSECNTWGSCLANVVYLFTVGIGGGAAYIGAWILSYGIKLSLDSTAYALDFLTSGWQTTRDIANMFFILILVYIAFTVILKAETNDTMKRLVWVIAVALLINFSFFFVRVVIDAGNIIAVQFYNAIEAPAIGSSPEATRLSGPTTRTPGIEAFEATVGNQAKDLTASIMNGIGVQSILGNKSFKKFQEDTNWFTELITLSFVYLAVGIMFFMLAAAFITIGVKFIIRIVILWLLLISAPLALICKALGDKAAKLYDLWQDQLLKQTFFPPIFLFVLLILTKVMEGIRADGTILEQTFKNLGSIQQTGLAYLVPMTALLFILMGFVIALLYIGLKAADKISTIGSGAAHNFTGWATRMMSNGAYGGSALLMRSTIGRGATWAGNSTAAGRTPFGKVFRGIGNSRMDVRNLPGGKELTSTLKSTTGYDLGKPTDGKRWEAFSKKWMSETPPELEAKHTLQQLATIDETWAKDKQRLEQLEAAAALGSPVGGGILNKTEERELAQLRDISKKRTTLEFKAEKIAGGDLAKLGSRDIDGIVHLLNKSQYEAIEKSKQHSQIAMERLEKKWHNESKYAPKQEAAKQLEALGELNKQLKSLNAVVGKKLTKIDTHLTSIPGTTPPLNAATATQMKKEVEAELDLQEKTRDDRRKLPAERSEAGETAKNLKKQESQLNQLVETLQKIPPNLK